MQIVNPLEFKAWDDLVLSNPDYSFFHSKAWAKVISESYCYKPLYFSLIKNRKLEVLIPLMEVNSFITGRRGVSLPFSDFCEPIIDKNYNLDELLSYIFNFGKQACWKYAELKLEDNYLQNRPVSHSYFVHELTFDQTQEKLLARLRSTTKQNINRSIKEKVTTRICFSLDAVKEFYRMQCLTRKRHHLPPQPWKFFKKIFEHIIKLGNGFVVLAYYNNRPISGGIFLCYGKKAVYKFSASIKKYRNLRANYLVTWKAIEWCLNNKIEILSFGRTDPGNKGLLQFKRGWRGREKVFNYFRYNLVDENYRANCKYRYVLNKLFMPFPTILLKGIGRVLYRHVG